MSLFSDGFPRIVAELLLFSSTNCLEGLRFLDPSLNTVQLVVTYCHQCSIWDVRNLALEENWHKWIKKKDKNQRSH